MATTLVFDGTTFATDAAGSSYLLLGRLYDSERGEAERGEAIPLPRVAGHLWMPMGSDLAGVTLEFKLLMTLADRSSWMTAVAGKKSVIGTLVYAGITLQNCRLAAPWGLQRVQTHLLSNGTYREEFRAVLTFERVR